MSRPHDSQEQAKVEALLREVEVSEIGGDRARIALEWLYEQHPRAFWPIAAYLRRTLRTLDRTRETATLHILRSHCPEEQRPEGRR